MTLYEWIKDGTFPKPLKIGRLSRWTKDKVFEFVDGLKA
jgi:predicted DNA-binding transcriptional regulator AlpA